MGEIALERPNEHAPATASVRKQRSRLGRWARRLALGLLLAAAAFVVAVVATARRGDPSLWPPAPGAPTAGIVVVSHGYHSGVALPRALLAEEASVHGLSALGYIATRFAGFDWLEIGWGDERFYRQVPTVQSLTFALAVHALFWPNNPSVLHVVGVPHNPRTMFPYSDLVRLDLSTAGFERLAKQLDASFARDRPDRPPQDLGPGLYGTSLFFRANGAFNLFHVCNHWTAGLLDAAGVPTAPVLATLPDGLLLDLAWRSGLAPLPRPSL